MVWAGILATTNIRNDAGPKHGQTSGPAVLRGLRIHRKDLYVIIIYNWTVCSLHFFVTGPFGTSDGDSSMIFWVCTKLKSKSGNWVQLWLVPHISPLWLLCTCSLSRWGHFVACLFLVRGSLPLLVLQGCVLSAFTDKRCSHNWLWALTRTWGGGRTILVAK
jgi:hypothetical protein